MYVHILGDHKEIDVICSYYKATSNLTPPPPTHMVHMRLHVQVRESHLHIDVRYHCVSRPFQMYTNSCVEVAIFSTEHACV